MKLIFPGFLCNKPIPLTYNKYIYNCTIFWLVNIGKGKGIFATYHGLVVFPNILSL